MSYKSVRLLSEAINTQMGVLRKALMDNLASMSNDVAQDAVTELRVLIAELVAKAELPTIEDVTKLAPSDYVATMKPLVENFHRQLMNAGRLPACLCDDLGASGCVLILIGDGRTIIRTAADPSRPEVALAMEAILASIDDGMKQVVAGGVAEAEKLLGVEVPDQPQLESALEDYDQLLREAERVGWDTADGEELRRRAKKLMEKS